MSITDMLYLTLTSPSQGLKAAVERKPVMWAILLTLFSSAIFTAAASLQFSKIFADLFGGEAKVNLGLIVFAALLSLAGLFVTAGVLHGIALLLKGQGSYLGLICGLSFANLPSLFYSPLTFLSELMGGLGLLLYLPGIIALFIWVLVLNILAVRHNYGFSNLKAVGAYSLFLLAFFFLILVQTLLIPPPTTP